MRHGHFLKSTCDIGDPPPPHQVPQYSAPVYSFTPSYTCTILAYYNKALYMSLTLNAGYLSHYLWRIYLPIATN